MKKTTKLITAFSAVAAVAIGVTGYVKMYNGGEITESGIISSLSTGPFYCPVTTGHMYLPAADELGRQRTIEFVITDSKIIKEMEKKVLATGGAGTQATVVLRKVDVTIPCYNGHLVVEAFNASDVAASPTVVMGGGMGGSSNGRGQQAVPVAPHTTLPRR